MTRLALCLPLSADLDFALGENLNLRFWFAPHQGDGGELLKVEVMDSLGLKFENLAQVSLAGD